MPLEEWQPFVIDCNGVMIFYKGETMVRGDYSDEKTCPYCGCMKKGKRKRGSVSVRPICECDNDEKK